MTRPIPRTKPEDLSENEVVASPNNQSNNNDTLPFLSDEEEGEDKENKVASMSKPKLDNDVNNLQQFLAGKKPEVSNWKPELHSTKPQGSPSRPPNSNTGIQHSIRNGEPPRPNLDNGQLARRQQGKLNYISRLICKEMITINFTAINKWDLMNLIRIGGDYMK